MPKKTGGASIKKHSSDVPSRHPLCPGVAMAAGGSPLAPGLSRLALGCSLQSLLLSLCLLPASARRCRGCSLSSVRLQPFSSQLCTGGCCGAFPAVSGGSWAGGLAGTRAGMFPSAQLGAEVELPALWEQQVLCVCVGER